MSNFVSQAGQMELHSIPNDMMGNINPITLVIFIPLCDRFFYPSLRRMGIRFKPITRIFWGFMLAAAAMVYAAYVQNRIYTSPPCYKTPSKCEAGRLADGTYISNHVNVAIQAPAYLLIGLSEIFASITGLEYAFTKAPASMKSLIGSLFLFTTAVGAAMAGALSGTAVDPNLVWMYSGLALVAFVAGLLFWRIYSPLNKLEDSLNELD